MVSRRGLGRDYRLFWAGQTTSSLGNAAAGFVLPLLIYNLTGSAVNLALATAAQYLPLLFFGLILGAYVDRLSRRRVMIASDLAQASMNATIPVLAAIGILSVTWIYVVILVNATIYIAFTAAEAAAIPSIVDKSDLIRANGRLQAGYQGAAIAGPTVAGILLAAGVAAENIILLNTASYIASTISLVMIRTSFNVERRSRKSTLIQDVRAGLDYVLAHPILRNVAIMACLVNFAAVTAWGQLIYLAKEQFGATDAEASAVFAVGSAGVVIVAVLAGRIREHLSFATAILGALMLYGVAIALVGAAPSYWLVLPLWAIAAASSVFFNINTSSLRQTIVPSELLGRVMTIAQVAAWSANPLGALLGGWVIAETGNVGLVYICSGFMVMAVAFAFRFTALGRADAHLPQATAPEPAR